jgi:hypothetical protein
MICTKYKKLTRGRPSLDVPCLACGAIYREHGKTTSQTSIVNTPVVITPPIAVLKAIDEEEKDPGVVTQPAAPKFFTRKTTPMLPPLRESLVAAFDSLVARNGTFD